MLRLRTCRRVTVRDRPRFFSSGEKLFDKILVANRGEIACRVFRSCKKLGIKTVAVHSEPDTYANHVLMADETICIGPAASAESYLRMDRILHAIESTGAQAVHPGYGFLSENAEFCQKLEEKGITFIGPHHYAIDAMGDKIHSKKIASDAKVNTIPGFVGEIHNEEEVVKVAKDIGYPVMIKASAGGGGKGMRVAYNDEEAAQGFRLSKREAAASFGDDTIFVEKFVEEPRHIEIQILVDSFGNGVYLNERECSIQRRNQKVIEEAPSTFVDPETRKAMGEQALALAKAVNYQSAGTVEFLMDKDKNFYFLEMNTRLQVEHPISEMITKVDLVEQMIRVAAGEKLPFTQDDIGIHGWAIESRVYAEDPYREFLPSTGLLTQYKEPSGEDVRVDTGVREGSEISMFYDPMISKLVTHGKDRDEALSRMRHALDTYRIQGLRHNLAFLRSLCDHPAFIAGNITTKFIPEHYPQGFQGQDMKTSDWINLAALAYTTHEASLIAMDDSMEQSILMGDTSREGYEMDDVVLCFKDGVDIRIKKSDSHEDESEFTILIAPDEEGYEAKCNLYRGYYQEGMPDVECSIQVVSSPDESLYIENSPQAQVIVSQNPKYFLVYKGQDFHFSAMRYDIWEMMKYMPIETPMDLSKMVVSPMPGMVYSINVKEGQTVEAGQEVCVVEAMKMQNALQAPSTGQIKSVMVKAGQSVDADQILIEME